MDGLRALDLMLRTQQIVLGTLHLEYSALQLSIQLRNFQYRQGLALAHPVANVHVDLHHEASDFGMNVHHLVRLKLPGKASGVRNVSPHCRSYFRRWSLCGIRAGMLIS
jgi:hypothetical protein